MIDRIDAFLIENDIDINNKKILLGFSGGPDSTLLLEYLLNARSSKHTELRVMHLNHKEREAADYEEEYVEMQCKKHQIECSMYSEDVYAKDASAELGFERAAREIRLKYLIKDAEQYGCDYIMTGHNLTDRVETMLINLERGTGLRGLVSMRPVSGKFVKPLLSLTRREIRDYLKTHNADFLQDETNEDQSLGRNRIRHNIIPVMEQFMRNGLKGIEHSLNVLEDAESVLKEQMENIIEDAAVFNENIEMDIRVLKNYKSKTMRAVIYYTLQDKYMINTSIIDELERIVLSDKPNIKRSFNVFTAIREYGKLRIINETETITRNDRIELKEETIYNGYRINRKMCKCPLPFNDREFICLPLDTGNLYVRTYRQGDRFSPFGMNGSMKLKDYFINRKIPVSERRNIPIITDSDDNILWVTGYRRSALYSVNTNKECTVVYGQKN